jgi:hypothetical protein
MTRASAFSQYTRGYTDAGNCQADSGGKGGPRSIGWTQTELSFGRDRIDNVKCYCLELGQSQDVFHGYAPTGSGWCKYG